MNNRIIAQIARRGGVKLLDLAVARLFPQNAVGKAKAAEAKAPSPGKASKPSVTGMVAGATLASLARRSVPGAIILGGGILAKTLYDRRQARQAEARNGAEKTNPRENADGGS